MAVSTKRSASHAFSIDSLMSKQPREELISPVSPPQASSVTPPTTPHLATANNYAQFLRSFESQYLGMDPLGLGMNHPVFAGALPSSLPGHITSLPPSLHPLLLAGSPPNRDSIFNPWLQLARQQQTIFGQRLGDNQGLLMHPFRKPKRIRTAFSPSQLLKLEQSFEKNHYVVGQERKDLATNLGLTETQVKVWFQNRRTKHKRTKDGSEDGMDGQKYDSELEEDDLEICDEADYESASKRQRMNSDSSVSNH